MSASAWRTQMRAAARTNRATTSSGSLDGRSTMHGRLFMRPRADVAVSRATDRYAAHA